jgi:ribosomal protein S18 acetylase RimI-like enzyme
LKENAEKQAQHVQQATSKLQLPATISIRAWREEDFTKIQHLSNMEGWPTPENRPQETLAAWQQSWPTLVAVQNTQIIGFLRGLTDGSITTYIMEFLVDPEFRRRGIGQALLETCHLLYPRCRIELTTLDSAQSFYEQAGFRRVGSGMRKSYVR